jgi:hypothetical protein
MKFYPIFFVNKFNFVCLSITFCFEAFILNYISSSFDASYIDT